MARRSNQSVLKEVRPIHWKDWCWSSSILATWSKELTHCKRPWCWKRLKTGGEGGNRGWDGWMASLIQWTCSVQFSCSVVSNSLWPHELQHARPPCPSPTPGICPNSCPLSHWCYLTNSSSIVQFSSCLQSFPDAQKQQGLFKWVSSSHQVAKILEFQLQHQSFQWTPRTDLL